MIPARLQERERIARDSPSSQQSTHLALTFKPQNLEWTGLSSLDSMWNAVNLEGGQVGCCGEMLSTRSKSFAMGGEPVCQCTAMGR